MFLFFIFYFTEKEPITAIGEVPLHYAAFGGHSDVVEYMMNFEFSKQTKLQFNLPNLNYRVFKMDWGHFKELLWLRFWCQAFFPPILLMVEKCVHIKIFFENFKDLGHFSSLDSAENLKYVLKNSKNQHVHIQAQIMYKKILILSYFGQY